ncbi:MAG: FtsX-like permease family protein [Clostridia bacterium]|nr:FtsX-like permease family protein [Clostridia bacterium]
MNIVNKLTLRHLKENKGRTVVTTLGICVSVAMITAVFVAAFSLLNLLGNLSALQSGNWHGETDLATAKTIEQLQADERVDKVGVMLTTKNYYHFSDSKKPNGAFTSMRMDKTLFEMKLQTKLEGRLPESGNEIIINKKTLEKYFPNDRIGSTINITSADVKFDEKTETESYENLKDTRLTIVGVLDENLPTDYANFIQFVSESDIAKELKEQKHISAYFTLKKLNYKSGQVLDDIAKEYDLGNVNDHTFVKNDDLLISYFSMAKDGFLLTTIIPLCLVCLVIIMIASVMLIYNAFGMSLSERIRYLGMLSSVGATKKQKRSSVYYEGLILGAIGIPVGTIAGIIGISITLYLVGDKIISSGVLTDAARTAGLKFTPVVPPLAIILIVFFSALTIFISLYIPARKASKITPIDAIRQRDEFKLKAKKIRSSKLIRAIFGYEGEIANKSLKRNRRKTRTIISSIALSVVLFLCVNYFCSMLVQSNNYTHMIPYQISISTTNDQDAAKLKETLSTLDGVEKYYSVNNLFQDYSSETSDSSPNNPLLNPDNYKSAYKSLADHTVNVYFNAVSDDDFNKLCEENGIDPNEYYNQENIKFILMDDIKRAAGSGNIFEKSIIGSVIDNIYQVGNDDENETQTNGSSYKEFHLKFSVGDLIKYDSKNYVCGLNPKGAISLFAPESEFFKHEKAFEKESNVLIGLSNYQIGIETKDHKEVYNQLDGLDGKELNYISLQDLAEQYQMLNSLVFALQVFVYGFITLITMIAIANIINTVSTGIMMRRKEFAMLKSVGTTPKGFNKMICLESFFYGAKALLIAFPISVVVSYVMNRIVGQNSMPFSLNWQMYLASAAAVFVIVGISMFYSVHKLKDDSIVETLKTEIN